MTKRQASPTNRGLYLFMKKLQASLEQRRTNQVPEHIKSSFRESMVELHRLWYETEEEWKGFLAAVRKRGQGEISDKLMSAALAMFQMAVAVYRGPLSYEASLSTANLQSLIDNSECPECGSQGDVIAILPHPVCPQWKLQCPDCAHSWHTKESSDDDLNLSDQE